MEDKKTFKEGGSCMAEKLLIEIGTEEIPSSYIDTAIEGFKRELTTLFDNRGLSYGDVETYATPRRLALLVDALQDRQEDRVLEIKGPPESVAFKDGKLTEQGKGFARSRGVREEDLFVKDTPKGRFVFAKVLEKGMKTEDIIKDTLEEIVSKIPFPRYMVWNEKGFKFARPIRWMVVLFGSKVIDVEIAGVKSSGITYGHRFLCRNPIKISRPEDYVELLKKGYVIPDSQDRRKTILKLLNEEAEKLDGTPVIPEELLDEVVNLVEYPCVIAGRFHEKYLKLPREVVETAMETHQRYFPVEKKGELLPYFLAIINTHPSEDIKRNNEKVLTARLEDARFYYLEDIKVPMEKRVGLLDTITYQEGLGTLLDRVERLKKLAEFVSNYVDFDREVVEKGIELSKADLTTLMIRDGKEFTGLEGKIGYHYAIEQGIDRRVADVIKDHYLPRYLGDELPETTEACVVSIVDRVDHIIAGFIKGKKPTGSKDPLGLRRAANGLIEILIGKGFVIPLEELFKAGAELYNMKVDIDGIVGFINERIERVLEQKGIPYDITDAVIASGTRDLRRIYLKAEALFRMKKEKKAEYEKLVIGQKRAYNILKGKVVDERVKPELFVQKEEKDLYEAGKQAGERVRDYIDTLQVDKALEELLILRPFIDSFFDRVLVMHEDLTIRENRLKLLMFIRNVFLQFADLSLIVLEGGDV
ncbi:MAG TPA: glycine--tRNA ligase subunit beta [candidate division WOR-3 bacterium]|uniref:Glycine--tRNA ligase beta subunit n=1 Tax=candidate division WOR-3 bacterium TaxID=2052148 RepID=A0A7C0VBF4_UNCW3|nr:glycine--tRNA ligase subunit beta [candidate division WOR-3 bacterium]